MKISLLKPKTFFLGIVIGFAICCCTGYLVSKGARLSHFTRFFLAIQPQMYYYPTVNELVETARHDVSHDKILVLLGGSSVFRGAGQDPNELWSDELQRILGDKFKILNYASDSASPFSFGGVLFRILKKEYKKIIFVAAASPLDPQGGIEGSEPYTYLFWEAYYKKMFQPADKEKILINKLKNQQIKTAKGLEEHLMCYLDSLFYFKNLWNWISYRFFFTVWNENSVSQAFKARRKFHDVSMDPSYKKTLAKLLWEQYSDGWVKVIKQRIRGSFVGNLERLSINHTMVEAAAKSYDEVFLKEDRNNILFVQSLYNPKVIKLLPLNFQNAYLFLNKQSDALLRKLGYHAIEVGLDFSAEDYQDMSHLVATGGKKMAQQVAVEVQHIAKLNGYYN